MVAGNFGLEAVWPHDVLRKAAPREQESSGLLYSLCLMELSSASPARASTGGGFGMEPEASCRFSAMIIPCETGMPVAVAILPALESAGVKLEYI